MGNRVRNESIDLRYVNQSRAVVQTKALTSFRNGSDNPKWKANVSAGTSATNVLDAGMQEHIWGRSDGKAEIRYWNPIFGPLGAPVAMGYEWVTGVVSNNLPVLTYNSTDFSSSGVSISADNRALIRIYKDIRAAVTRMDGGTALGELGETIRMIKRPAQALRSGVSRYFKTIENRVQKMRRGRKSSPLSKRKFLRDVSEMIAGTYLESVFGWRPFLNDLKDASSTLLQWTTESEYDRRDRARGHGFSEKLQAIILSQISPTDAFMLAWQKRQLILQSRVIYLCGLKAQIQAPFGSFKRLAQMAGVSTLQDFVPTAWELIPWSFVVDYFTNIGDVLTSVCTDKANVTWVQRTQIDKYVDTLFSWVDWPGTKSSISNSGQKLIASSGGDLGYAFGITSHVSRYPLTAVQLGYPSFEWKLPAADSAQWINLGALALQMRGVLNVIHK